MAETQACELPASLGPGDRTQASSPLEELQGIPPASQWILGSDGLELNWASTSMGASGHGHFTSQCLISPSL